MVLGKNRLHSHLVKGRALKPYINTWGYNRVGLSKDGKPRHILVHVLVAEAFIGPKPYIEAQVNHKNGVKTDNTPLNIEWGSPTYNLEHAYVNSLRFTIAKNTYFCNELGLSATGSVKMASLLTNALGIKCHNKDVWRAAKFNTEYRGFTFSLDPIYKPSSFNELASKNPKRYAKQVKSYKPV